MFDQDFIEALERNMQELCNQTNEVLNYVRCNNFNDATVAMAMLVGCCTNAQAILASKIVYSIEKKLDKQ